MKNAGKIASTGAITKTRQERHHEIKQLAATANGFDKLYS
jgi:hypothetical protein